MVLGRGAHARTCMQPSVWPTVPSLTAPKRYSGMLLEIAQTEGGLIMQFLLTTLVRGGQPLEVNRSRSAPSRADPGHARACLTNARHRQSAGRLTRRRYDGGGETGESTTSLRGGRRNAALGLGPLFVGGAVRFGHVRRNRALIRFLPPSAVGRQKPASAPPSAAAAASSNQQNQTFRPAFAVTIPPTSHTFKEKTACPPPPSPRDTTHFEPAPRSARDHQPRTALRLGTRVV